PPAPTASGPTAADPTTHADALGVPGQWLPPELVPPRVRARLEAGARGAAPETLKAGDAILARARNEVLADNRTAIAAAAAAARGLGFEPLVLPDPLVGDAASAGRLIAARLLEGPAPRPVAGVPRGRAPPPLPPPGRRAR